MKNDYKMYDNKDLSNQINQLESKFTITDKSDSFHDFVNFSQNQNESIHNWFKYREGYSHNLVQNFINNNDIKDNEYIIDPFCGSGTTLLQGYLNNKNVLGIDVNPLSIFISKTKTYPYNKNDIHLIKNYLGKLKDYNYTNIIEDFPINYLKDYFNENNLKQMLLIKIFISLIKEDHIKNFFKLHFLSIVEQCSERKKDGSGLKIRKSKITDVFLFYINKIENSILDLLSDTYKNSKSFIVCDTALNIKYQVDSMDNNFKLKPSMVIFSPPYANGFDYFTIYRLELLLGDFITDIKELNLFRKKAIHSFRKGNINYNYNNQIINLLISELENKINIKNKSHLKSTLKMIKGYFNDMELFIEQCAKVLPSKKYCYIVVDQNSYEGKIIPTDLILANIAEKYNFSVEEIIKCRKARTSSQQLKKYPYLNDLLRESIIVLVKN